MTDIQHEHNAAAHEVGRPAGVGEMLRSAREARGESVLDVAHALKLSPRQVEAIELERFDQLPGPAFVRGFVRNYARYLGIESEPLIAGLRRDTPNPAVRLAPVRNASGAMPHGTAVPNKMLKPAASIIVVMAIALGLGAYFDWFKVADTQPLAPETGAAADVASPMREPVAQSVAVSRVTSAPEPATQPAADSDGAPAATAQAVPTETNDAAVAGGAPDDGGATVASEAAPVAAEEPASAAVTSAVDAPAPPAVATDTATGGNVSGGESAATPASNAAADTRTGAAAQATDGSAIAQLVFRLAGESWIQVRDKSGSVVYTGIGAPDSTRTVQGEPPFAVVIGNATQVSLEYDGHPVDLAPHTRSGGVARMTLE